MDYTFLWRIYSRKTFWLITSLMLFIPSLYAQELIATGVLPSIQYEFTGPKEHVEYPTLVHALAYSQKKEAGNVKAIKTISVHFKTFRIPNKGFETILYLHPQQATGDLSFYNFYWPKMVLPALESFKLIMKKGEEYIYVKNAELSDSTQQTIHIKFRHQRFAYDWELSIKDVKWKAYVSDEEFKSIWNWINEYQSAVFLLQEEGKLDVPVHLSSQILYKTRWLALYTQMEEQPFYQNLVELEQQDPEGLKRDLDIRKYVLSKEIEQLKSSYIQENSLLSLEDLAQAYLQPDFDLHEISQRDVSIYGAMYFNFDPKNKEVFCLNELQYFFKNDEDYRKFELLYQEKSIQKIDQHIAEKLPKEALYQIEKFDAFYEGAIYLKRTATFNQYKSKAVYDIYLSYIQVARQALDRDRIDMAMEYLDQASRIQKQYPSDIINDIYVEKELRNLVKRALERYKHLLENGEHESAKQVKDGILGLMKRFGFNHIDS